MYIPEKLHTDNSIAYQTGVQLSAECVGFNEKGLTILVAGQPETIPTEHISESFFKGCGKNVEAMLCVGKRVSFTYVDIDGIYVPSRYALQKRVRHELLQKPCGTVLKGVVTANAPFGLFVDIGGGLTGLVPLKYQTVHKTVPGELRFPIGSTIYCVLHSKEGGKFTLATAPLLGTFKENIKKLSNTAMVGTVKHVEDYGVFVEIFPNLVGLTNDFAEQPDVKEGDKVVVGINSYCELNTKLRLSILSNADITGVEDVKHWSHLAKCDKISSWWYNAADPDCNIRYVYNMEE